uniref:Uncharacterized protein n=1 Tax=Rousettus aegyptiacus TaxID=9407 RepID=A0A7J8DI02_ROUAE|nr:hypothetical protein HJG63_008473 [Rousettus aegyptiacus]
MEPARCPLSVTRQHASSRGHMRTQSESSVPTRLHVPHWRLCHLAVQASSSHNGVARALCRGAGKNHQKNLRLYFVSNLKYAAVSKPFTEGALALHTTKPLQRESMTSTPLVPSTPGAVRNKRLFL